MEKRYKTQSISVSEEELEAIKVLAKKKRVKPAALARELFYRGVFDFLLDGEIFASESNDEIFDRLKAFIETGISLRVPVTEANQIEKTKNKTTVSRKIKAAK